MKLKHINSKGLKALVKKQNKQINQLLKDNDKLDARITSQKDKIRTLKDDVEFQSDIDNKALMEEVEDYKKIKDEAISSRVYIQSLNAKLKEECEVLNVKNGKYEERIDFLNREINDLNEQKDVIEYGE